MAVTFNDNILNRSPKALDDKSGVFQGGIWRPYNNIAEVINSLPIPERYIGLMVDILEDSNTVKYWFRNGITNEDLVVFNIEINVINDATTSLDTTWSSSKIQEEITELDESLSDVAKTGNYNDLINKPDIPSLAPVQSVNTRTGNVTGLAEQSSLDSEINVRVSQVDNLNIRITDEESRATQSELELDERVNKSLVKSVEITATEGQTIFIFSTLIGQFPYNVIQGGSIEYTLASDNIASDLLKRFSFDIVTGTITMPTGLSLDEPLKVFYTGLGNPAIIPTSVVNQTDFNLILKNSNNVTGPTTRAYYDKDTGNRVDYIPTTFVSTDRLKVNLTDTFRRVGFAFTTANQATGVVAFDINGDFIGNAGIIPSDYSFVVKDLFPTADTLGFCSTSGAGLTVYRSLALSLPSLDAKIELNKKNIALLIETRDGFTDPGVETAYTTSSGGKVISANWRRTALISVSEGDEVIYTGFTTGSSAYPLFGYDETGSLGSAISLLNRGNYNGQTVTIPTGVKTIIASSRAVSGDVYKIIYNKIKNSGGGGTGTLVPDVKAHMPKNAYSIQGSTIKINPFGIVATHPDNRALDIMWDTINGNEKCLSYTPGVENSQNIKLQARDAYGIIKDVGTTTIQVTHTIQSPSIAQNIIHLGDSTVYGQGTSPLIQGAIINELSRRLTGTGTALMSGAQNPSPLALTNLYFRGTRGNQPIKHEGYPGAGLDDFERVNVIAGSGNPFYNPSILGFDLNYYLTTNNFDAGQTTGGVTTNGDNLTIMIQCIWNHVYTGPVATAVGYLKNLLNKIHAQKPGVKVVLIGLPGPAYPNKKDLSGRNVSVESIMREAILTYSDAWQTTANDAAYSSWVDFLDMAPFFFPLNSYASVNETLSIRDTTSYKFYLDYVHRNEEGYAQEADNLFNYIIWKLCKAT